MEATGSISIRILTHNIRYATDNPFKGEEVWEIRRPRLLSELHFHTIYNPETFICLQEVLYKQLLDIMTRLNEGSAVDEWAYIGIGRDDGRKAGEYSPIIYRPAVWKLEYFENIWLSETPDRPSKGWDAVCIRILTVGIFQHRQSKKKLMALNTHLDDRGEKARFEAAKMIIERISKPIAGQEDQRPMPIFLAGDFNSEPTQEAYMTLTAANSPIQDAMGMALEKTYGHTNTFTGFGSEDKSQKRVDFLFVGPRDSDAWKVKSYAVLESRYEDGVCNSDHRAVVGDFVLDG